MMFYGENLKVGKLYIAEFKRVCMVTKEYIDDNGDLVYDYYYLKNPEKVYATLLHDASMWREVE